MQLLVLAGTLPVLLGVPLAAVADSGAARGVKTPVVTEAEFLSALDQAHPAIVESSEELALARARIVAAAGLQDPVIEVTYEDPEGPAAQLDWSLSWQLPAAGRRPTVKARKTAADAEAARLEQRLLSLRLAMREVYADWAIASARRDRLDSWAERYEALAARERLRVERGESSGLEAHRLELAAEGVRARIALATATAERARASAFGWSPDLPRGARPILPSLPAGPRIDERHPLLRAAEQDLAAALLEREAAGRLVKSPEISLGWQRQEDGSATADGPIVGVAWSLPLLDRNRSERAVTEARVTAARARLERLKQEHEAARSSASEAFEHLVDAHEQASASLDRGQRMLDGAKAAFQLGEATLTDLLETYRSVAEAELAVLDLHQAALSAGRELAKIAGTDAWWIDPSKTPSESDTKENLK